MFFLLQKRPSCYNEDKSGRSDLQAVFYEGELYPMDSNRPQGRKKVITGESAGVHKHGNGLGTGPVGDPNGHPTQGGGRDSGPQRSGGRNPLLLIIIIAILALGGGGAGLGSLFGGGSGGGLLSTLLGGGSTGASQSVVESLSGSSAATWQAEEPTQAVDTTVASGSRAKRTQILGNGKDQVTLMVYMCGTDLESKNRMGTNDLVEMANAQLSDNVHVIVYTGGCKQWNVQGISNTTNQIYEVTNGRLKPLVENAGNVSMTDPDTLTSFIKFCTKNYPANRNCLIFWDHGGGSVSGYGYDERFPRSGSMTLDNIDKALKNSGTTFDFIGFDACLMATMENALMLDDYADYLIASEETEPGIGWYYTEWLNKLAANSSMPTLEIGKEIVDDFVETCDVKCNGQNTTLSVIDLAELANTVPDALRDFSDSLTEMIKNDEYKEISAARGQTREFSPSTKIDQIDLIHFAENLDTDEGTELAANLRGAVKYNRTSANMTNAYGISIYFPYRRAGIVDKAVQTYKQIGMDDNYARAIQEFASLEVSGQAATGGSMNALPSLLGTGSSGGADMLGSLLSSFLGGNYGSISGLSGRNTAFLNERALTDEETETFILNNYFDPSNLVWTEKNNGDLVIRLSEDQWSLVEELAVNMFYDDGEGYIDLGLDNTFEFDNKGDLLCATDDTWLAVNGQPVAYYYEYSVDSGDDAVFYGRIPALLNGERVDLIVTFSMQNPYGLIVGARPVYANGETDTSAKNITALSVGDQLQFICDYYGYDGSYQDSFLLGDPVTFTQDLEIANVHITGGSLRLTYRFTDIYQQHYWTPPVDR